MADNAATTELSPSAAYWRKVRVVGFAVALLSAHFALANAAAWDKCAMFDEPSHIASGDAAWRTGDFRIVPLAISQQLWVTWPLQSPGVRAPSTDQPIWHRGDNWGYGRQLLYELGNNPQRLLRNCRMMNTLASVVLAGLAFVWARRLFGTAGGFVALVLYAFNPTVLGHAAAATPDTFAALAFTAAAFSLIAVFDKLTPARLLLSSAVWGLALTAKFSTLLLLPIAGLMVGVRFAAGRPLSVQWKPAWLGGAAVETAGRLRQLPYFAAIAGVHAVGAWAVIWSLYDFRFETFQEFPNDPRQLYLGSFDQMATDAGKYEPIVRWAHTKRLLPEPYLYCFAEAVRTTRSRVSFLDGTFRIYGTPAFFPLAFLYKTPPAFFAVAASAFAAHVYLRRRQRRTGRPASALFREGFFATYPLWCILLVYGYTSISGPLNIGLRHLLPMFAPACILCGVAGDWFTRLADRAKPALRVAQGFTLLCLALYVVDTAAAYPNYVAYFNLPSGGIRHGHRHLVDSSLDWGQELPALRQWLDRQGVLGRSAGGPRVYLSYFGTTPPSSAGLHATLLPCYFRVEVLDPTVRQEFEPRLSPGVYCISATMLQSLYLSPFEGPWQRRYETRYRELLAGLSDKTKQPERAVFAEYQTARMARLCAYLRTQEPLEVINGAILVYRLTAADLDAALLGNVPTSPDPPHRGAPIRY